MSAPLVAIVGRPNVGKSTLFNRLVGRQQAIVEDTPGVTRDRLYGVATWEGRSFLVVDTGGIDPSLDTGLPKHIMTQAEMAIREADSILLVVDAVEGLTAIDLEIAVLLRRSAKPVTVVANKADSPARELLASLVHELGLGPVHAVSAAHGRNTGALCDAILAALPASDDEAELIPEGTRIAFLGRPNAGKSTLVNALLREPRVIVDAQPGTTRDAVYLPFRWADEPLVLIDTAGLRRRRQTARAMEQLAAIKAVRAMERTQVVVLVIDASVGATDQDQRIARMAFERGKGVVIAMHKWDLVKNDKRRAQERMSQVDDALGFLHRPYVLKTSVVGAGRDVGTGTAIQLDKLVEASLLTARALGRRIATADLNEELQRAVLEHSPPVFRGKPVKLYYATQAENTPPLLVVSASHGRCLDASYERYLLHRIRDRWNMRGIPVRLVVRGRGRGNRERAKPP